MPVDVTNIQRPQFPYPYVSLTNSNRYQNITNTNAPPSAIMIDSDINYLIEACRALYEEIDGSVFGQIPGSNVPANANKLVTTDGAATISWVNVTDANCALNSIAGNKLINGSVGTVELGNGSVTNPILGANSVGTANLQALCVTDAQIANNTITANQIANLTITATKIANLAVTAAQIANNTITATQIANNTITGTQIQNGAINFTQLAAQVLNAIVPIGTIIEFAGTTGLSANWLECNGQTVSRTTYATLFANLGTTYGSGDGTTTFGLPDRRGRVPVGIGSDNSTGGRITAATASSIVLGGTFGAETVTLTVPQIPPHTHSVTLQSYAGYAAGAVAHPLVTEETNTEVYTSGSTGGGSAHINTQPSIFMRYYIRAL